jgi:hypothetical protein
MISSTGLVKLKHILTAISVLLFVSSLYCVPFKIEGDDSKPGIVYLLLGWIDLAGAGISWLANPLLLFAWMYLFRNVKTSIWLSSIALIFSTSFLCFDESRVNEGRKIISIDSGYYLWLISIIIFFASTIVVYILENEQPFIHPHELDPITDTSQFIEP